jgi:hypothetical protein
MPSHDIRIVLASPPDRDHLVAEIFVGTNQLAEVRWDHGEFLIELYARRSGEPWTLPYVLSDALSDAVATLRDRLEPGDDA